MAITPPYTLGLDIGMASVGAALLAENHILGLHVRTFDRAETAKEGYSLNLARREARLTRRRIRRRAHRLLRLRRLFKRCGLLVGNRVDDFAGLEQSPWQLRAEGLDRCLTSAEWAAVLYHVVKHRGFQSNRKSEAKADEKAGQMLSGVTANQQRLSTGSYRTMGEMAALDAVYRDAKRNKGGSYAHTFARADLEAELRALFAAQHQLGNTFAGSEFEAQVRDLLLARRPTLSGENLLKMVGRCTFEPTEYRAPKASHRAERFVWLGKLNNLRITHLGESYVLSEAQRSLLIELPFLQAKLTFKQARKALMLPDEARFNLVSYRAGASGKDPEDATFFEAKAFHALRKIHEAAGLKSEWQGISQDHDLLDDMAYALTCFKDDNEARAWLARKALPSALIEGLLELSFDNFIQLSQQALKKILPYMEQGQRYDMAVASAGYHHSQLDDGEQRRRFLPAPDRQVIINPVVYRALNQARKLVNAIVREYGPPAAVNIELARDLSKPFDERRKIEKLQKEFQVEKQQVRDEFLDAFGTHPKALDLVKWRLYREQDGQCAYCQQGIDADRLMEPGYVEVDHVLPYSRSFDDGMSNKVLVLTAENRNKGNRTPWEYLGSNAESPRWQRFEAWVRSNKKLRDAKRRNLLRRNFQGDEAAEFRDRHLNDTRYICREFKRMIEQHLQWDARAGKDTQRCVVVAGQLTSLLRARWGLIKVRENGDLHHALDAAVIAAANASMVKRMAAHAQRRELALVRESYVDPATGEVLDLAAIRQQEAMKLDDRFPEPWPHFRQELLARLSPEPIKAWEMLPDVPHPDVLTPVRVSRAPTRRGLGAAHQETIRSIGRGGSLLADQKSAVKVPLTSLSLRDLDKIVGAEDPRNEGLMRVLKERLEQFGGKGDKAFAASQPPVRKPSKAGKEAPIIRSVKLLDTQKSGLPVRGGMANNGSMVRVDIFTKAGRFHAVPIYVADAVKPELPNRAVVQGKPEEDWTVMDESFRFLFSLHPNDWVRVMLKTEIREGYFGGLDRATGAIHLWLHDRNQEHAKEGLLRGIGIKTAVALEKCHVDLLGRLHRVSHEERLPLFNPGRSGV